MGRLDGKNAIVTGAGGAIAASTAEQFAAEGAGVICLDVDGDAAGRTAERINDNGGRALSGFCDVADEGSVREAVAQARGEFPGLHLVVNAAAARSTPGNVVTLDTADWQRELNVNLTGIFLVCKYAIPALVDAGGGSIVNIASQLGSVVVPERPTYVTSKAAVIQLTRSIALDFAGDNIRCNSVSPGATETDRLLVTHGTMENARKVLGPMHPIGRLGQPVEIANAAVFLASDEASFVTGSDLVVDGGYIMV